MFGEAGFAEADLPYELMAETLENSPVAVFRRSDLLAGLTASPQAALEMIKLISRRRSEAEAQVADLVFLEVPKAPRETAAAPERQRATVAGAADCSRKRSSRTRNWRT